MMNRRQLLIGTAGLAGAWALSARAQGADTPLHMIVPFPPGGGTDVLGRVIAEKLAGVLKRNVIVDNRPGAGGIVGTDILVSSPKDGNTLLFAGAVPSPRLYTKPEGMNDLAAVCAVARSPYILAVHPSVPAKNVAELIALAKAKPDSLSFGSPGNATPQHLATELFQQAVGAKLLHVPYKGTGPMVTDLVGGQIKGTFATATAVEAFITKGRLRALAVTGSARLDSLPNVPTMAEAGYPDFQADIGYGVYVPAGTPAKAIEALNRGLNDTLAIPEVKSKLAEQGFSPVGGAPEVLTRLLQRDVQSIGVLIRSGKVKIDA